MSKKEHKQSKMKSLFKGFRKSTTDLSEWSKNDEKLMKTVECNDIAKVDEQLRKKNLNPTKLGPKGLSVFHVACSLGYLEVVTLLISHGAEVNVLSIQGNTSVQLAARDGHPRIVEKLVEAGGVIDHKDGLSLTALHHACVRGKMNCVQVLLKHGADPNSRDKTGKPPLFYAAFSEDLPICKELVDRGASVNAHDEQQLTPLMAAAKKGSAEICEFLLKKGADPTFCDTAGHDGLSYGLDSGFENLRDVFNRAPTRAQWSISKQETDTSTQAEETKAAIAEAAPAPSHKVIVGEPEPELPTDKENMVAKFVPESTPEPVHRSAAPAKDNDEVTKILAVKRPKADVDDEMLALRAASPPKSIIDQRTLEAYKAYRRVDLEEENEHINEDLKRVMLEHKRLQEAYDALKKQLSTPAPPPVDEEEVQELEDELSTLKSHLTEEQEKNVRLIDKMKKLKKKFSVPGDNGGDSGDDSWNDSDEDELFETAVVRKSVVVDHKPQTLLLLQNQVAQLRQENKLLRERLHEKTGSLSSLASLDDTSEIDRLRRRLEDIDGDRQRLHKQMQENNVFPEEQIQNLRVLEEENTQLHTEVKHLRTEVHQFKLANEGHRTVNLTNGDSDIPVEDGKVEIESAIHSKQYNNVEEPPANVAMQELDDIRKENTALLTENSLLTEELEALRETYNKLVIAGDNLQEMYDQLVLEKEQLHEEMENMAKGKQELAKENEYLLADGNAMHDDIERLVHEVEKLHDQNQSTLKEKEDIERKLSALNQGNKASDFVRIVEERDKLHNKVIELETFCEELKQNHDIVLEEIQSLQSGCQRAEYERDQIQQEFDSLQDEFENVQGSQEGLQQDYTQLEQDYSDLLNDKEKLEQEFLDVQTASVNVENHNPVMFAEKEKLLQENEVLMMEKEQLEMTMKELSKSNALIQEELAILQEALQMNEKKDEQKDSNKPDIVNADGKSTVIIKDGMDKATVDAVVEKDRRIRSLQIQISRLQQQLAESDGHYREVISTYRTHLLSAVQGHMDPDVRQALYNIIELRSTEQFC